METNGRAVVALLGAGRGGTTLLYKLLSMHREVAYLSNYEARLPRCTAVGWAQRLLRDRHELKLRTWFGDDGGAYFNGPRPRLRALVPVPVEGEPLYAAAGIPEEPSAAVPVDADACKVLAHRLHAVRRAAGARILLTKRTSNNRRVPWLEVAFPGVRYIHLLRDGRAVAASLSKVGWWGTHKLFWTGLSPDDMVADGHDHLALAAENWVREVAGIDTALASIAPERVHTLRYEALLESPIEELRAVFAFMGIDTDDDPAFVSSIQRIGLRPARVGLPAQWSASDRERVDEIQSAMLDRHGYAR
jgi:hypothetical protein